MRLSKRSLRTVAELLEVALEQGPQARRLELERAQDEVQALLRGSLKRRAAKAARKAAAKAAHVKKVAATGDVYAAVAARAGHFCECGCGQSFSDGPGYTGKRELDHFFGRARSESVETTWLLRWDCHRRKTLNQPTRAYWQRLFINHCEHNGYTGTAAYARKELAFVEAKESLPHGIGATP